MTQSQMAKLEKLRNLHKDKPLNKKDVDWLFMIVDQYIAAEQEFDDVFSVALGIKKN